MSIIYLPSSTVKEVIAVESALCLLLVLTMKCCGRRAQSKFGDSFQDMTVHKTMALMLSVLVACLTLAVHVSAATPGSVLSPTYYDGLCGTDGTKRLQLVTSLIVTPLVTVNPTLIPALIRLCFHDSFVQGVDGSALMDNAPGFPSVEKDAPANADSLRGFEVIDEVKSQLESICPGVYSCADILQECARVAMRSLLIGSLQYNIRYGRRDGRISSAINATIHLPSPHFNYNHLVMNFAAKNFSATEMAILSGAHTFGAAHCRTFTERLYNFNGDGTGTDPSLNFGFSLLLKVLCPRSGSGNGIVPLNIVKPLPAFDNQYFKNIQAGKVLLTSDNELQVGDPAIVDLYANNNNKFRSDFANVLVKLTELQATLFPAGEIRANCHRRN